jgi:hypothetical protein
MAKSEKDSIEQQLAIVGMEHVLSGQPLTFSVGQKNNYNLQPSHTPFELWSASTIEWVANEARYRARVLLKYKSSKDIVAINSWHQDFADAERVIDLVQNSMNGTAPRWVYNIYGEVLDVHWSVDHHVYEVQGLIWSMLPA